MGTFHFCWSLTVRESFQMLISISARRRPILVSYKEYVNPCFLLHPYRKVLIDLSIVFPGCFIPSVTQLVSSLEAGTSGALIIDSIANIGIHYGPTLRRWRELFEQNFDLKGGIRDSLAMQYPDLVNESGDASIQDEVEVFRRKWIYY